MQLTPDIESYVKLGKSLKLVGTSTNEHEFQSSSRNAVLCTATMTYSIKKVETSNSG